MKRFIKLDDSNKVVGVRYGSEIVPDEIESETGELGQIMQSDGTFVDSTEETDPHPYDPTNAEIAQMISDLQADLIIAGVI